MAYKWEQLLSPDVLRLSMIKIVVGYFLISPFMKIPLNHKSHKTKGGDFLDDLCLLHLFNKSFVNNIAEFTIFLFLLVHCPPVILNKFAVLNFDYEKNCARKYLRLCTPTLFSWTNNSRAGTVVGRCWFLVTDELFALVTGS